MKDPSDLNRHPVTIIAADIRGVRVTGSGPGDVLCLLSKHLSRHFSYPSISMLTSESPFKKSGQDQKPCCQTVELVFVKYLATLSLQHGSHLTEEKAWALSGPST